MYGRATVIRAGSGIASRRLKVTVIAEAAIASRVPLSVRVSRVITRRIGGIAAGTKAARDAEVGSVSGPTESVLHRSL